MAKSISHFVHKILNLILMSLIKLLRWMCEVSNKHPVDTISSQGNYEIYSLLLQKYAYFYLETEQILV